MKNNKISTILCIPEIAKNTNKILLQMQLCSSSADSINYEIINSFTNDKIKEYTLNKKISKVYIDNTLYENELKFIGNKKVEIFTKYIGIINNKFGLFQE